MTKWLYLFIAGGIGTLARYMFTGAVYNLAGSRFPFGTLIVNLVGCFLAGFFLILSEEKFLLNSNLRLAILIGFLGAFTTFSTFIVETGNLIRDGESMLALGNILLSVIIGFFFFRFGISLGRII